MTATATTAPAHAPAVLPTMLPLTLPAGYEIPAEFAEAAAKAWKTASAKLTGLTTRHPDRFPLYTEDGKWVVDGEAWTNWCEGFLGGQLWMLSRRADDAEQARFRSAAEHYSELVEHRKSDDTVHDLGFLFWSTYRRWFEATGDPAKRDVVVEAGRTTASRYREAGRYMPSFRQPDSLFIDIMMNIHMALYAAQQTGDQDLARKAVDHCLTTRRFLMRGDGSASHEGMFDLDTGAFLKQTTQQGFSDDGSWARGQAWALYGFGTVYRFTGDRRFLETAIAAADFYIEKTGDRLVPPNDWEEANPVRPYETSAAAAAAGGFWQLAGLVQDRAKAKIYADYAVSILRRLTEDDFLASPNEEWEGVLKHGSYHEGKDLGVDESVMWGDYWFLDTVDQIQQYDEAPEPVTVVSWATIDDAPLPDSPAEGAVPDEVVRTDIAIIGSGMGGGTMAYALKDSGARVLIIERGHRLPAEPQNSDLDEVYLKGRYKNADTWYNGRTGAPFKPGVYYWVGGNTKVYGACLPRFRASDFEETQHQDGASPAWPFSYADLEPYYTRAEKLYQVHGQIGEDPSEPFHSEAYPYPALDHEPAIQKLADSLRRQGLHPFRMANGLDADTPEKRALCATSDGAPNEAGLKSDAEKIAINPALSAGVGLLTDTKVTRLITGDDGRTVVAVLAERNDQVIRIEADKFILAAGAVNSAALLLRSATKEHPRGLGNSSGLVGRNYMVHNSTFFIGINPFKINKTLWQKTLGLNDWYEAGPTNKYPLGNLQMLGKLRPSMLKMARNWAPKPVLKAMSDRSIDIYLTTEDLPRRSNGVSLVNGKIHVWWEPNNLEPHKELVRRISRAVRKAGYPVIFTERMGIETNSHQCGTAVAGHDPSSSVLNPDCRAHDLDNLWVVDSSFFPSSAALNPALTIAANALRVADTILAGGKAPARTRLTGRGGNDR